MKIAIVNDIKIAAEALRRIIRTDPKHNVAWIAYDGVEAVKKCAEDTPDLILMDLIMPNMGGVEATRQIMKSTPCAILIVTSTVSGNSSKVFEAMGYGALDVVKTPAIDMNRHDLGGTELLRKIERIGFLIDKISSASKKERQDVFIKPSKITQNAAPLLVIGSSTGGPKALAQIISHFSKKISFATVIIQHVDEKFANSLAQWLTAQTSHSVQVAKDGATLSPGTILLAGKNDHLTITKSLALHYTENPKENPYRPSVDVFFKSAALHWPVKSIAVLLTGMGSDGALGMKSLQDSGWLTIAQQEDTCVVYGMPKAAIELGAATSVLPLEEIGPSIIEMFKSLEKK